MKTAIIDKADNKILGVYEGSTDLSRFKGDKKSDLTKVLHIPVPDGADHREMIYDGTDLIEDSTAIQATYDADIADLKAKIEKILALTNFTQLLDAVPGIMTGAIQSNWATYRQSLRDLPSTIGTSSTKDFNLDTLSGQDDLTLTSDDPGGLEFTLTITDPVPAIIDLEINYTQALKISTSQRKHISVQLEIDEDAIILSTVQDVIDAINAHKVAKMMVDATLKSGATGTNIVDSFIAQTNLAGGAAVKNAVWQTPPTTPTIPGVN